MAWSKSAGVSAEPKNCIWSLRGTPNRKLVNGGHTKASAEGRRLKGSSESNAAATRPTAAASGAVSAKTDTQWIDRQAGTTPVALNAPMVGFHPTMLLNAAGTRPEPAVSVPSAKLTNPDA